MKKEFIIVSLALLGLTGCSTLHVAPMDDAYFWEDSWSPSGVVSATDEPSEQVSDQPVQPVLEYTNVQDTTVTVRIKR